MAAPESDREQKQFRADESRRARDLCRENFFRSAWARKIEAIEPAKVVTVAQVMAVR